jgi:hypothetical protein
MKLGRGRLAAISLIATTISAVGACPALAAGSHAVTPHTAGTKAGTAGVPGDITGAGLPDVLNNQNGNLTVLPPHGAPFTASTYTQTPDGYGWTDYQVSSRGSLTGGALSDLYAFRNTTHTLYAYPNDAQFGGTAGHFTNPSKAFKVAKPATCAPGSDCTGYDPTWNSTTQVLATDGVDNADGLPDLVTVEGGKLWYYPGKAGVLLGNPVLLGSGDWSKVQLIAPGKVGGTATLWAREPVSGAFASYPLSFKADGTPTALLPAPTPIALQNAVNGASGPSCLTAKGDAAGVMYCTNPEHWLLGADGTLRSNAKCLDAENDAVTGLADCDGRAGEKWTTGPNGTLVASDGRCLSVNAPGAPGGKATLTTCASAPYQSWGAYASGAAGPNPLPAAPALLPQSIDASQLGPGAFTPSSFFSAGDLDGDGHPDLLANESNYLGGFSVDEFPGTATGFGTPVALGDLADPSATMIGTLNSSDVLYSACASLRMQPDGNVVLTNLATGQQLWSTGTGNSSPAGTAYIDPTGSFVVTDIFNNQIWSSHSPSPQNPALTKLTVGDDCNLVLRDGNGNPTWSSHTHDPAHDTNGTGIGAGTVLHGGDKIGQNPVLSMGVDGNLTLADNSGRTMWTSSTGGNPGAYATLQADGNLVIYTAPGAALWSTNTGGHPGAYATVGTDGNLTISDADSRRLWSTRTPFGGIDQVGLVLYSGLLMSPGGSWDATNATVKMQQDGNLVIYSKLTGHPLWSSNTYNNPGAHAVMQGDGNLVVYAADGHPLWSTNTGGRTNAHAVLTSDNNLGIYAQDSRFDSSSPLWSSNTSNNPPAGTVHHSPSVMRAGDSWSNSGAALPGSLTMQADGNLVYYSVIGSRTVPTWSSKTNGNPGAVATLQNDGNFVVYAADGHPLWSANTYGNVGAYLDVQPDGNVVLYNADGLALWATSTAYWQVGG